MLKKILLLLHGEYPPLNNDTLFPVATLILVVIYIISDLLGIPMFKRSITDHSLKVSGVEDDSNF